MVTAKIKTKINSNVLTTVSYAFSYIISEL